MNLRITNMVCSGKLPFSKLPIREVILKSKLTWQLINAMTSPILQTRFYRDEGTNLHRKKKSICVSIWWTGSINIVGILSFEEAKEYYDLIVKDLKEVLKNVKLH